MKVQKTRERSSRFNGRQGSLLLEIIVVIGLFAIITPLVAQIIVASLQVNKWTIENTVALGLADETIKAADSISFEKWQNIYSQNKNATDHYHPIQVAGRWAIAAGEETVNINGRDYVRYFTISDVCRDNATKAVVIATGTPPCTAGNSDDPSTQKITVTVNWAAGGAIVKNIYLTRWRNQICEQTNWGIIGSGPADCPSNVYETATDIDPNTVQGSLILLAD